MSRRARIDSLPALHEACWTELGLAAQDRRHPWRTPVLASRDGDGVDARTVVLREVDVAARRLVVYTDARSPKVAQLRRWPQASLCAWSPQCSWQLRLQVRVAVRDDDEAVAWRWARMKASPAAKDYLSPRAPGSEQADADRDTAETAPGACAHFAVLELAVRAMDWLELHPDGHRRACFDARGARWRVP